MITALDLETSGFSFRLDDLIEIGAVSATTNNCFSQIITPSKPLSSKITRITGITNALIKQQGVAPKSAALQFYGWLAMQGSCKEVIFVGHNIIKFDMPFLIHFFWKLGLLEMFKCAKVIDTLAIVKTNAELKKRKQTKLGTLVELACGEPIVGAHRALADARGNLQLIQSAWFQEKFPEWETGVPFTSVMQEFWERYTRLQKVREYKNACPVCNATISPYWKHFHSIQET